MNQSLEFVANAILNNKDMVQGLEHPIIYDLAYIYKSFLKKDISHKVIEGDINIFFYKEYDNDKNSCNFGYLSYRTYKIDKEYLTNDFLKDNITEFLESWIDPDFQRYWKTSEEEIERLKGYFINLFYGDLIININASKEEKDICYVSMFLPFRKDICKECY